MNIAYLESRLNMEGVNDLDIPRLETVSPISFHEIAYFEINSILLIGKCHYY